MRQLTFRNGSAPAIASTPATRRAPVPAHAATRLRLAPSRFLRQTSGPHCLYRPCFTVRPPLHPPRDTERQPPFASQGARSNSRADRDRGRYSPRNLFPHPPRVVPETADEENHIRPARPPELFLHNVHDALGDVLDALFVAVRARDAFFLIVSESRPAAWASDIASWSAASHARPLARIHVHPHSSRAHSHCR